MVNLQSRYILVLQFLDFEFHLLMHSLSTLHVPVVLDNNQQGTIWRRHQVSDDLTPSSGQWRPDAVIRSVTTWRRHQVSDDLWYHQRVRQNAGKTWYVLMVVVHHINHNDWLHGRGDVGAAAITTIGSMGGAGDLGLFRTLHIFYSCTWSLQHPFNLSQKPHNSYCAKTEHCYPMGFSLLITKLSVKHITCDMCIHVHQ